MKSIIKVAVVAVGLLFAGNAVNAQQKLGHINSADLLQAMPEMKTADASFKTFATAKQSTLEKMDAERQKKITVYQEKAKTISEANKDGVSKELQTLATEIQDLEKRLGVSQQKSEEELQAKRTELYQPVFKKAEDAVKVVAKEKGYAYVFDISQPGVVYFDGGDDMLAAVKAKLGITAAVAVPKK
ncbi:MAG: OmpH family outer membrane protein [Flavobacterium sp.]|nr:OmpH family outer membrane protein [Pedobacter sp.]